MDDFFPIEQKYKYNYTWIIITFIIIFILLLIIGCVYECTDSFTNWELITEKFNPINVLGVKKYIDPNYVPPEMDYPEPAPCICSFDLDYTLTNSKDPTHVIEMCKSKGCKLTINTARPSRWVEDIPLEKFGFIKPWYDDRDHYFNPKSYMQTARQVGEVKSNYLQLMKDKYKVPDKKCVILFDDADYNLNVAQERGYGTIKASQSGKPGLTPENAMELYAILSKC